MPRPSTVMAVIAISWTVLTPAWAAAQAPAGLEIVQPTAVVVHPEANGTAETKVTIRNDGSASTEAVRFAFVGDAKIGVTASSPSKIGAYDVARYALTITLPKGLTQAKGELVASVPGRPAATAPLALTPANPSVPSWVKQAIWVPLVVATVLVVILGVVASTFHVLRSVGPVEWDFSKSWASNITVFSALLGTILAAGVLPDETTTATVATFAGLELLFGVGVLVGPFLYTALQWPVGVHKRSATQTETQYQGCVLTFMLATIVVLWATAGQFWTIWHLFGEIRAAGALPHIGLIVFRGLILLGGVSLAFLIVVRMWSIIKTQTGTEYEKMRRRATKRSLAAQGVVVDGLPANYEESPAFFVPQDSWPVY